MKSEIENGKLKIEKMNLARTFFNFQFSIFNSQPGSHPQ